MKILILAGSHEVVVAGNEADAQKLQATGARFSRVVRLDEPVPAEHAASVRSNSAEHAGSVRSNSNVLALRGNTQETLELNTQVDALEERLVKEAMTRTGNNQVQAARLLGITRGALQYKLKKIAAPKDEQADLAEAA